jgi:periplasmic protein CpxP/Spy
MNDKKRLISLWVAIGLLLCLNLATIGWMMNRVRLIRTNRQNPETLLVKRLDFSPEQQTRYRQLRAQFEQRSQPLQDSIGAIRRELFSQFGNALPDSALNTIQSRMERQNGQLLRLRFRHWQQVRAICTPRQQVRFDRMTARLSNQSVLPTN